MVPVIPPEPEAESVRLHITPFSSALLKAIIPPSVLPFAKNISYHSLQSFPEKEFGFVDLPAMEAQKIKKKLNGAILKGTKIQIEDARPEHQFVPEEAGALRSRQFKTEKPKKRKRDEGVLAGAELHDRKIKRGWTDPTVVNRRDKKLRETTGKTQRNESVKSKYTSGPECLFRTTVPANVAAAAQDKPISGDGKPERRKRSKPGKETVVHEFAKTTKFATFLRSKAGVTSGSGVAEYVEGQGWVDNDGNIVEAPVKKMHTVSAQRDEHEDSAESSVLEEDSSDNESVARNQDIREITLDHFTRKKRVEESSTSSSGTSEDEHSESDPSSSDSDGDEVEKNEEVVLEASQPPRPFATGRPISLPATLVGLSIEIPKDSHDKSAIEVHPLEALYKRRQPDASLPKAILPSFSFFGADGNDEQEVEEQTLPMTPYTKQDFTYRGMRSAAPTPDTAHPSRSHSAWPGQQAEDDDEADETIGHSDSPTQSKKRSVPPGEKDSANSISDFQKWFYEHRGDTNRAWKKRRKTAAKEKRRGENRKSGDLQ